ncbi:hypothetical protein GW17_00035830 [Ensete ventricosum]|nr:hypothetical protein GW17_00035830 [Ensete ventricosum]
MISCAERYFRFCRTADATRVEIAAIHLEGDAIQWFNWIKHTHGGLSWQRFKEGLLNRFEPFRQHRRTIGKDSSNLYNTRIPNKPSKVENIQNSYPKLVLLLDELIVGGIMMVADQELWAAGDNAALDVAIRCHSITGSRSSGGYLG